jgi:hypothetical protein
MPIFSYSFTEWMWCLWTRSRAIILGLQLSSSSVYQEAIVRCSSFHLLVSSQLFPLVTPLGCWTAGNVVSLFIYLLCPSVFPPMIEILVGWRGAEDERYSCYLDWEVVRNLPRPQFLAAEKNGCIKLFILPKSPKLFVEQLNS